MPLSGQKERDMITTRNDLSRNQNFTWIDVREMDRDDISVLTDEYMISAELLADIMDVDEQARIEKEDDYTVIICRLPANEEDDDENPLERRSIPLGIVLFPDKLITICRSDSIVIDDFARHRFRQCPVDTKEGFVISILGHAALVYIRLLKYINRQKDLVEEQLNKSIMNYELIQLLTIQKSLVFLTTSVTGNQILLDKLQKNSYFKLNSEDEIDFLEDAITDNKQAIEMAKTYQDILTGTMDAYASVISNNMNVIMKRLTIISLALMFPTFITGFFGMNVYVPGMNWNLMWIVLAGVCLLVAVVGMFLISISNNKSILKATGGIIKKVNRQDKKKKKTPSQIKYMRRKRASLKNEDN